VAHVTAIYFDPIFIDDARNRLNPNWPLNLAVHDMVSSPPPGEYDVIFSLDVLEHIQPSQERVFISNMISALKSSGTLIVGMPSLESQVHASPQSKVGHVNCKTSSALKTLFSRLL